MLQKNISSVATTNYHLSNHFNIATELRCYVEITDLSKILDPPQIVQLGGSNWCTIF